MSMKIKLLLSAALLPSYVYAQSQGQDMGLGSQGTRELAYTNEAGSNLVSGDGKSNFIAVDKAGRTMMSTAPAGGPFHLEDSAATSLDGGVTLLGMRDDSPGATFTSANGDYGQVTINKYGALYVALDPRSDANVLGPLKREDVTFGDGDGLMMAGYVREDALTANTNASADATQAKVDSSGRQIVTMAPPGEFWQSCSASNTGTSDTAIKASVASNRIYVTSISCFNTAAVASSIAFKDGASQIYVGGISNSTLQGVAYYQTSLPVPLRLTSATAFNFAMGTTATATTCCAAGYISTQ